MSKLAVPAGTNDHVLGDLKAPVVLVEYGDYQCPYCGQAAVVVQQAVREFGAKLCVVFRNYPLTMHPQALPAAVVAEFAAKHGKFWPAHDALYANQKQLGAEFYGELLQQLGLSVDAFGQDVAADAFEAKIRADIDSGNRSGVQGTPAFFINGEAYAPRGGFDDLLNPIRALLGQ